MDRLKGKVAIITGGARGMGAAHAELFVAEGARVMIVDLREDDGNALAAKLGDMCRFHRLDVTSPAGWTAAVAATEAAFGRVDILVANAGIAEEATIADASDAHYDRVIAINQSGVFYGMRAVVPAMRRAGGGSIVNVASIASIIGTPRGSVYAASKGAITAMSRAAAIEMAREGIRVNTIHPGIIDTPMLADVDFIDQVLPMIPLGRLAHPREISNLALFLASDEASYVTGAQFVADGGLSAM